MKQKKPAAKPKLFRAVDSRSNEFGLFDLFDTGERDHVCELIKNCYSPCPKNHRAGLATSLTTILLPVVELYIDRHYENEQTPKGFVVSFKSSIEYVSQSLSMFDGDSLDAYQTAELANILNVRWTTFIAEASAYRIYHDLRLAIETNKHNAGKPRTSITRTTLEAHKLDWKVKQVRDGNNSMRGWKKAACEKFLIDVKTLNKIMTD